jgi:general secretion pathway protein D
MKMITNIIAKLDVVLAQVLIESVIIQVDLNTTRNLGVSYLQPGDNPSTSGKFAGLGALQNGSFLNQNAFGLKAFSSATNAVGANLQKGFNYLATFGNDSLEVTVNALASNSKSRVLQRPRIQTSNAKTASIFVGSTTPYPSGSYYGGAAYGSYSSIQQLPVGVSLAVTPLINSDGLVVMDIEQHIDSLGPTVPITGVGDIPTTDSKTASTSVAVRDGDIIMVGGLIDTERADSTSGFPFLKDVPLFGWLFRSTSKTDTRNELIILIRPTVLPTPEVAAVEAKRVKATMPGLLQLEREMQIEEQQRQLDSAKHLKSLE